MEFLATAAFGLEGLVKRELNGLGIEGQCENGGVRFHANADEAFKANLWLRTADRVLLIVGEGEAKTFTELFDLVNSLPWERYLPRRAAFPVSGKCARSQLMSVRDCQAITKKAVAERLKRHYRCDWCEESGAEYKIDVSMHNDIARLTLDTSGTALNRRGYRTWNGEAPLRETLAAALVMLSPWREGMPLWDPCCGTGTLLIEAAFLRADRAPGLARAFACESWDGFDPQRMALLRQEAKERCDLSRVRDIGGSDIDPDALALCKRHLAQAGLSGRITLRQEDLRELRLDAHAPLFLANPPYGERLSDRKACEELYRGLRQLRDRHEGGRMAVITAHNGFERCFGQRAPQKRRFYNGRLECQYYIY